MTNKNLTDMTVVLDRSGSMAAIEDDMRKGFDRFIQDQRKEPGQARVTLVQFDTEYQVVYEDRPIAEVPNLVLVPRGATALLDALGRTINATGARLDALPEDQRPGLVTFVVITDGLENSSHEFDLETVKKMINHQREQYSWLFIYLGANQDAIEAGMAMGFAPGQTMTYAASPAGVNNTYGSTSGLVANVRGGVRKGMSAGAAVASVGNFTDVDREDAVEK